MLVWFDLDRDGEYDENELPAPGVTISIGEILSVASAGFGGASTLVMAAGDYVTDADGSVVIDSLTAGQWDVSATPPTDTEVTYDSEGSVDDGQAQVDLPTDSAGFAWVGLVPAATTPDGGTEGGTGGSTDPDTGALARDEQLAATGASTSSITLFGTAVALLALGFALARGSQRGRARPAAR